MKTLITLLGILIFANLSNATTYTFDTNNQGWQQAKVGYNGINYETLYPNTPADWTNSYGVGSPEGSIFQSSNGTNWEARPYWQGTKGLSAGALGDLTGKKLQAYIRSTANWIGRVSTDVVYARWTISQEINSTSLNMWVSKAAVSINLNDTAFGSGTDSDWLLKQIDLNAGNFFQWPVNSNGGTFADALKYYTSFGIAILPTATGSDALNNWDGQSGTWGAGSTLLHYGATATSGTATFGIDGFVPEPATMALLGLGALALRRKKA
jgi:hypothetical protein